MAGKLRVTQTKSTISHIARNRATIKALGLHGIGSTSVVPDNDATRGMVRQVRFLVTVEEIADARTKRPSRATTLAIGPRRRHEAARPAPRRGLAQGAHPRRSRHRGRQGQDRGPRHEGPEGPRRRLDPALVRGRPDAAPRPDPQAARLQEPLQDRVRGRERRRHRGRGRARRASRPRRRPSAKGKAQGGAQITVNQDILRAVGLVRSWTSRSRSSAPASSARRCSSSPTRSPASARAKIEAAGGTVQVLEVPTKPLKAIGARRRADEAPAEPPSAPKPAKARSRSRRPRPPPSRGRARRGDDRRRRAAERRPPTRASSRRRRPPTPTDADDRGRRRGLRRRRRPRPATTPRTPCSNRC